MSEHKNCYVEPLKKPLNRAELPGAMVAYLAVGGMGCPRCAICVHNGLLRLEGVLAAEVFLHDSLAVSIYTPDRVSPDDLIAAVSAAGNDGRHHYQAKLISQIPAPLAMDLLDTIAA